MSHSMNIKVYYEDTDAGGVVYHASYLRFLERGRTELLTELGHDPARYHRENRFFVVTHVDIRYLRPTRLGETIKVSTGVDTLKRASIILRQQCLRNEEILTEAEVTVAFLGPNGKPARMPEELINKLNGLKDADQETMIKERSQC